MPVSRSVMRVLIAGVLSLVAGTACSQTTAWTGTWGVAPQTDGGDTLGGQTVRHVVHTSVSGSVARIRLSNEFGTAAVTIQDVHIALRSSGSSTQAGTDKSVTFGGAQSVTIQAGKDVNSDAVTFAVPQAGDVTISYYLPQMTTIQSYHQLGNQDSWVASGDVSSATAISVTATHQSYLLLTGLDVQNSQLTGSVVAIGASITDGYRSSYGANHRWPDYLAARLNTAGIPVGVLNEGISGNKMLKDGAGTSMLNRFAHDVLGQSAARWVIISDDPINDLLDTSGPPTATALTSGLTTLLNQAHGQGLKVICSTLTPFGGYASGTQTWTSALENERAQYDAFVKAGNGCDAVLDQDTATHDPANPTQFLAAYDSGDHLHPNDAGYQAIANAVSLSLFQTVSAVVPQNGSTYHLISQQSGLALDNGGSTTLNAKVTQWTDSAGNINQEWKLVDDGGGYFTLVNQRSGMALDNGGSTTDGSAVKQYYVNYNNNQYWKFVDVGGGYYHLDCKSSSRALDNAASTTLGSIVTQWTDGGAGNANQNWKLEFVR
jgi:lysophospholipase L1-like esterase